MEFQETVHEEHTNTPFFFFKPYSHYKKDKQNEPKSELNIKISSKQNKVKHFSSKEKPQER